MTATFIDTSFLLAVAASDDELHARAIAWQKQMRGPLVLSQFVLLEFLDAMAKPAEKEMAFAMVGILQNRPAIEIVPLSQKLLDEGLSLMRSHADKEWGITDCISFQIMRDRGLSAALTHDHHFVQAGFEALLRREPA